MKLVIATRRSRLALWQAEHVRARLLARHPGLECELLPMSTRGDELLETRLDEAGGKGLFVKELETALADGRAQLAVHSMKDVPAELPPGFHLAAILEREDPRDAFVSARYGALDELPRGAIVGTSSLRRAAQLRARRPGIEVRLLRGNVDTRLAKLDRGDYDAIVLAVAGLARLGLQARIRSVLEPEAVLPSPGQGALGIESLAARADVSGLLRALDHAATACCVRAERAVSRALGGSCTVPLGAFAQASGERLRLRALVSAPDAARVARADCEGSREQPEALGERAADELRRQGAADILAALER
ncbi:MAG TPA: hydroxymethylbilane synthase [Burkholderiales bacterium]|nr:hydroxymethylbilane synthase [Burkholderiales bacterium]